MTDTQWRDLINNLSLDDLLLLEQAVAALEEGSQVMPFVLEKAEEFS